MNASAQAIILVLVTALVLLTFSTVVALKAMRKRAQWWFCSDTLEGAAYMGSIKGDKFHKPDCRHAHAIRPESRICFVSRKAAIVGGKAPCGHCNP